MIKEKMTKVDQQLDRAKAVVSASALKTRSASVGNADEGQAYWYARKCVRISPVEGSGPELWGNVGAFFYDKMRVPKDQL